jgi:hypothetical protein
MIRLDGKSELGYPLLSPSAIRVTIDGKFLLTLMMKPTEETFAVLSDISAEDLVKTMPSSPCFTFISSLVLVQEISFSAGEGEPFV